VGALAHIVCFFLSAPACWCVRSACVSQQVSSCTRAVVKKHAWGRVHMLSVLLLLARACWRLHSVCANQQVSSCMRAVV
jgi:hypothetical protein